MIKVFFDMDGVLAKWDEDVKGTKEEIYKQLCKPGYYRNLPAYPFAKQVEQFVAENWFDIDCYILSCVPCEGAKKDKKEWLKEFVPSLAEKAIFLPDGANKMDYIEKEDEPVFLFDDYSKNLADAKASGVIPVKVINHCNGKSGNYENKINIQNSYTDIENLIMTLSFG